MDNESKESKMSTPADGEEQRLRDKVMQRRKDRQQHEDNTMTENPPASLATVTTATSTTKAAPQGEGGSQGSLPVSSSQSRTTETHPTPSKTSPSGSKHPRDDHTTNDHSTASGSKGNNSLTSSGSSPAKYNEHSGKSRKRERRRQRRQMDRDNEGESGSREEGRRDSRGSREEGRRDSSRGQHYPPQQRPYHDYPPQGRWERDRGGGDRHSHGSSGNSRDQHRGGGGPPDRRYHEDEFGRGPPPPRRYERGRSPDRHRRRRSTSRSRSPHSGGHSREGDRLSSRERSREGSGRGSRERRSNEGSDRRKRCRDDLSSSSHSSSSSSSSSDDSMDGGEKTRKAEAESAFSKDQRTVFVTQLVMRTTEKDIRRYFKKKVGCKVNEVILLKDRRTGNHKGCAYVQFDRIEDVGKAVGVSGQAPDFQRFPILAKASESEKNYSIPASASVVTASMMGTESTFTPFFDKDGKQVEAQKVYVGGLDSSVSEEHLFAIFSQFGQLEKVSMQMDPATNTNRGYAFLSFRDPKDANLAIQSMSGQVLAGRPMKTGWASQASSIPGISIVTSEELPVDGTARAQKALQVLGQLVGGSSEASVNAQAISTTAEKAIDAAMGTGKPPAADSSAATKVEAQNMSVPTVADATESMQATTDAQTDAAKVADAPTTTSLIGGADNPTRHILVFNMYDKDEETDAGWEKDIKEEFADEASKFGKIEKITVMFQEAGGKIYVSFKNPEGAKACAENLAGRWFDKRQLRVDFVKDEDLPDTPPEES